MGVTTTRRAESAIVVLIAAVFWLLRSWYWERTSEELFSDMSDFQYMADCVRYHFCFWWNDFFRSYSPPTVAVLRAAEMSLFGDGLLGWRIFNTAILFLGALWLTLELARLPTGRWPALVFFGSVALSKPSIFWSLKLSRESVGEAFTYLTVASALYALRRDGRSQFFLCGALTIAGVLVRGSAAPLIVIFPFCFLLAHRRELRRASVLAAWFTAGAALVWSPWLIRSYRLYGAIVPLSTQAPYAFFWDLGAVTITLEDGSKIVTSAAALQDEAPRNFANDYEASVYGNRLVSLWTREHWRELPEIMLARLARTVTEREVHLTHVSRSELFPEPVNSLLIDKTALFVVSGLWGLVAAALVVPQFWVLLFASVIPWLNAGMLVGYARMLEPSLPVILFGNVAGLAAYLAYYHPAERVRRNRIPF